MNDTELTDEDWEEIIQLIERSEKKLQESIQKLSINEGVQEQEEKIEITNQDFCKQAGNLFQVPNDIESPNLIRMSVAKKREELRKSDLELKFSVKRNNYLNSNKEQTEQQQQGCVIADENEEENSLMQDVNQLNEKEKQNENCCQKKEEEIQDLEVNKNKAKRKRRSKQRSRR